MNNKETVDIDSQFIIACSKGELDKVDFLLTSDRLERHTSIHAQNDEGFVQACQNGRLEVVEYLLTSKKLKKHSHIQADDYAGFITACQEGHLDIVQYLLSLPKPQLSFWQKIFLKTEIKQPIHLGFLQACSYGNLNIVKYFTDNDLVNIYAKNEAALTLACRSKRENIIEHFLYDLNYQINCDNLKKNITEEDFRSLTNSIEKRNFYLKLNQNLVEKNSFNFIQKI